MVVLWMSTAAQAAVGDEGPVYELRIYYAAPGKLDALNARFREHTCKLFEKHGMTNVGYWVPIDNAENRLIYLLSFPDRQAQARAWKAFRADPEWQKVVKETEADGKLVTRVESTLLTPTDYSPRHKGKPEGDHVYELRTYTAEPGRLAALNSRFRDHTCKLFEQHGMINVGYWTPLPPQKGAGEMLIYMIAHPSAEAREKAFEAFRKDPAWVAAKKASEDKAGGSLTVKDGVKFVLLKPTDYSPLK
jgi:hypothetical protein